MRFGGTISSKILIICAIVLAIFAIVFGCIKIFSPSGGLWFGEEGIEETVSIDGLGLVPGESREYSFVLNCTKEGRYAIGIKVDETKDGGLKNFVNVKIKIGDDTLLEDKLVNITDQTTVLDLSYPFLKTTEAFTVVYTMPLDVGNEAMNTYADFDMTVLISNEGGSLDE